MFSPTYAAQKEGNLQLVIDAMIAQRRYWDAYHREIDAFSSEDNFECLQWLHGPGLVGKEVAHLYPFRSKVLRTFEIAGLTQVQDVQQRFEQCPLINGLRASGGFLVSNDGLVRLLAALGSLRHHLFWLYDMYCVSHSATQCHTLSKRRRGRKED